MNLKDMIENTIKLFMKKNYPHMDNIPYLVKAKITTVYKKGEYVNIRILDKSGSTDSKYKEIPRVKTNNLKLGNEIKLTDKYPDRTTVYDEVEVFERYEEGDIVIVSFLYGDLSSPYILGKDS
jgi:hypothetical protein